MERGDPPAQTVDPSRSSRLVDVATDGSCRTSHAGSAPSCSPSCSSPPLPRSLPRSDDLTVDQAEAKVATLLNQQRTDVGRIVLRVDARLSAIARARSEDMAAKGYFAHQQPDGDWAWDLMTAAGVKWYAAGEIIAWNSWADLGRLGDLGQQAVA